MRKIAIVIDTWSPFVGGGQVNCYEIAKRMSKKNFQLDVLVPNFGSDSNPEDKTLRLVRLGPRVNNFNLGGRVIFCAYAFVYILRQNYDIVHAHAFLPGFVARLGMVFKGCSGVLTVHGFSFDKPLNAWLMRFVEKVILVKTRYSYQITVSRDFLKKKNINKNIMYIGNAPTIPFDKTKSKKSVDLLTIARFVKQKNLLSYLEALSVLKSTEPDFKAVIVGSGPLEKKIKKIAKNLHLSRNVTLLNTSDREKLRALYKKSKLFVLPSVYEGQSLAILDSMACCTPVLVTDVGENPFLIKNKRNGFLIKYPFEAGELAFSIGSILKNKNLEKIGISGYNSIKNYTWDYAAKKTSEVYEKNITKRAIN